MSHEYILLGWRGNWFTEQAQELLSKAGVRAYFQHAGTVHPTNEDPETRKVPTLLREQTGWSYMKKGPQREVLAIGLEAIAEWARRHSGE